MRYELNKFPALERFGIPLILQSEWPLIEDDKVSTICGAYNRVVNALRRAFMGRAAPILIHVPQSRALLNLPVHATYEGASFAPLE